MSENTESVRDLNLLESIEIDPDVTQASLANQLGVAVGTVNWHLKRLISKGYVKVKKAQRRKLLYIITPSGIALRAKLTIDYIDKSFSLYRQTRNQVNKLVKEIKEAGYKSIQIDAGKQGPEDILDIVKLTCIEHQIQIVEDFFSPTLKINGINIEILPPIHEKSNRKVRINHE
jgi:DNA-binding MarR family transcriptional regulator